MESKLESSDVGARGSNIGVRESNVAGKESFQGTASFLGGPRSVLSSTRSLVGGDVSSALKRNSYKASRLEMMQIGVPDDYIDALLNETYMEQLIDAHDRLNRKKNHRLARYLRLNKIIFAFLCMQAVLGILVAMYKTVLQPDFLYTAVADLQNVDLVLMMDASYHIGVEHMASQHNAVMNFTGELNATMERICEKNYEERKQELQQQQEHGEGVFIKYLPFLKYLISRQKEAAVHVYGGWLRVSTVLFNSKETYVLHDFDRDMGLQAAKLAELTLGNYQGSGQLLPAMEKCHHLISDESGHALNGSRRFCVVIGDNEAMCQKNVADAVRDFFDVFGDDEDFDLIDFEIEDSPIDSGDLLEYPEEVQPCRDFANNEMKNIESGQVDMVMMFVTKDEQDAQRRLKNDDFRKFVNDTTGCSIIQQTEGNGSVTYLPAEDCYSFIMASNFVEIAAKSRKVSELLESNGSTKPKPNYSKDYKYLFFFILPLNLVFYIIWSKIVRCTTHVKKKADRAMGVKKKMIKVTKTLVEKPRRDSVVDTYEANLTEVELAEVSSLRPVAQLGDAVNLRARLKGGYLHANFEEEIVDGNGQFADPTSNWVFEPVGGAEGRPSALQNGQRVRIRNARGDTLKMDASGSAFIRDDSALGSIPESGFDPNTEFAIESLEYEKGEEGSTRLGDTIKIKCIGTGKYVQIHKNGTCDGQGGDGPETQFNIDLGGGTIPAQALVKLQSIVTGTYLFGAPGGGCSAMVGGDHWAYWMMERREQSTELADGVEAVETVEKSLGPLKVGDVITLKGMNQEFLEVAADGSVHCGKPPVLTIDVDQSGTGASPSAQRSSMMNFTPGTGISEFVVERVGMGTVRKQDNSIRRGAEISLRPVSGPGTGASAADSSNHIRVDRDGLIAADGRVTTKEIGFTFEVGSVQDMIDPVQGNLLKGDIHVLISPLCNKNETKRLDALSAAWIKEEDLCQFKGAVVVASASGQYTVPKANGEGFQGWVAVVEDCVDIVKASKQAKSQGATGLIIKTPEVISLEKLGKISGHEQPDLPAVFMDDKLAKELNERGITMKGCEFKGKKRTDALRALGRMRHSDSDDKIDIVKSKALAIQAQTDVFKTIGSLMVDQHIEEIINRNERVEDLRRQMMQQVDEEDYGNDNVVKGFRWKVASNTHYLWSSSGGGATKMNVNFGNKAPPAASKREKIDIATGQVVTDASKDHVRTSLINIKKKAPAFMPQEFRSSVVGSSMLDIEDFKNCRLGLADELGDVHGMLSEADARKPLEQLPDDSDFKIEYAFEEVEIATGEKVDDLVEEELIDEAGQVVGQFAVPVSRFWIVAFGMILSTTLLTILLVWLLRNQASGQSTEKEVHPKDMNLDSGATIYDVLSNFFATWKIA